MKISTTQEIATTRMMASTRFAFLSFTLKTPVDATNNTINEQKANKHQTPFSNNKAIHKDNTDRSTSMSDNISFLFIV
jgi:hypothetical protein